MKETGTTLWASPNAKATNSSGFSAKPGGMRYEGGVACGGEKTVATWWSTSCDGGCGGFLRKIRNVYAADEAVYSYYGGNFREGRSIRCLKD